MELRIHTGPWAGAKLFVHSRPDKLVASLQCRYCRCVVHDWHVSVRDLQRRAEVLAGLINDQYGSNVNADDLPQS